MDRRPLADQAAEVLLDRVRAGEWELGAKLPGETTLAPQLGVGRSTVREAIRQLSGRGVLVTRQGAGVFVAAVDVPEDWTAVLRTADIVSVLEARIAIESEAAALAADRRTPTDLRAIRGSLAQRCVPEDPEGKVDADLAFHRSIVVAAHNPVLLDLLDGFTVRVRQAMTEMLRLRRGLGGAADQREHARLADAVADRDAAAARDCSRAHLRSLVATLSPGSPSPGSPSPGSPSPGSPSPGSPSPGSPSTGSPSREVGRPVARSEHAPDSPRGSAHD